MSAVIPDQAKTLARIKRLALDLLARRDHTTLELKQKLSKKGFAPEDLARVLGELEAAGYINHHKLIENYTHYRQSKGFGPRRIAMELQLKGIPETAIAEQLKITDNVWFTEIRTLWHKQFKGRLPQNARERGKQMRFMLNRGFTQEQIRSVLQGDEDD